MVSLEIIVDKFVHESVNSIFLFLPISTTKWEAINTNLLFRMGLLMFIQFQINIVAVYSSIFLGFKYREYLNQIGVLLLPNEGEVNPFMFKLFLPTRWINMLTLYTYMGHIFI